MISRRRFLHSSTIATAGLGLGASAAQALTLEEASRDVAASYHASIACSRGSAYHAQLLVDARAIVQGEPLSSKEREARIASLTCPICGCPLIDA
jgi:hypothetical protein